MADEKKKIEQVQVKINGEPIPLKGFVQDFIGQSILGMISCLKRVSEPQDIEVTIKVK